MGAGQSSEEKKLNIIDAGEAGDVMRILELLQEGENIDRHDKHGNTALMAASYVGNIEAVCTLLSMGADTTKTRRDGYTALFQACQKSQLQIAMLLIDSGAPINVCDKHGITPLHLAAVNGDAEMVALLLERRGDATIADEYKMTPLHLATRQGQVNVINVILRSGVSADMHECDVPRMLTPLASAVRERQLESAKILYVSGADPDFAREDAVSARQLADLPDKHEFSAIFSMGRKEVSLSLANSGWILNTLWDLPVRAPQRGVENKYTGMAVQPLPSPKNSPVSQQDASLRSILDCSDVNELRRRKAEAMQNRASVELAIAKQSTESDQESLAHIDKVLNACNRRLAFLGATSPVSSSQEYPSDLAADFPLMPLPPPTQSSPSPSPALVFSNDPQRNQRVMGGSAAKLGSIGASQTTSGGGERFGASIVVNSPSKIADGGVGAVGGGGAGGGSATLNKTAPVVVAAGASSPPSTLEYRVPNSFRPNSLSPKQSQNRQPPSPVNAKEYRVPSKIHHQQPPSHQQQQPLHSNVSLPKRGGGGGGVEHDGRIGSGSGVDRRKMQNALDEVERNSQNPRETGFV